MKIKSLGLKCISDGNSHIYPLPKSKNKINLKNPLLIVGFPGSGMIGQLGVDYIVEQAGLHQIYYIKSEYIMPGAVFFKNKIRHPARIYSNNEGTLCVLICDAPILIDGIFSLVNVIIQWCTKNNIKEVFLIDGILKRSFNANQLSEEKVIILTNENSSHNKENNINKSMSENQSQVINNDNSLFYPEFAYIGGPGGDLLASCTTNNIKCAGILIPTIEGVADHFGTIRAIETLNKFISPYNIDLSILRKRTEIIKEKVQNTLQSISKQYESKNYKDSRIYR